MAQDFLMIVDTELKDIVELPDGRIDCKINHPKFGWIPFHSKNDPEVMAGCYGLKLGTIFRIVNKGANGPLVYL